MKYFLIFLCTLHTAPLVAQPDFPAFLEGTWKVEGRERFERWDRLSKHTLKGFSYELRNGQMIVSEYLDISGKGNEVIYTASVIHQNEGEAVEFKLVRGADSVYSFENPGHDFPKKVTYQKLAESEVYVEVGGGTDEAFSFRMKKQPDKPVNPPQTTSNPNYDPGLAQRLKADDYGMKSYILVILKTGSNQTKDKSFIDSCFRGHMNNMGRLVEQGKLIVAGPIAKNENTYRGIFIFNTASVEEGEALLQSDPAIKAHLLEAKLYKWYGSAALPEYLEAADRIWKVQP